MFTPRPAAERGHANYGWLDTRYSFSFADYYEPAHMGISSLRVLNEDHIAPGGGFPTHPHRDMEIITYVLEGALEHKDSMGNGSVISAGDAQRLTAGTGVAHSEFNHSDREPVHLLQIWILPQQKHLRPSYEQRHFTNEQKAGRLCLIASQDGRADSVRIHQDVAVYATVLTAGEGIEHRLIHGRHAYVQTARGELELNGTHFTAGDGVSIENEEIITLATPSSTEVLLFDLH